MTEQLNQAIFEQLKPFFYLIGLLVASHGMSFVKYLWERSNKKEDTISEQLHDLQMSMVRLETKVDMIHDQHRKDINGLGQKLRDL